MSLPPRLISFAQRKPLKTPVPSVSIQQTVSLLINDIQVLALNDRVDVLEMLADFAREERALVSKGAQQHGSLRPQR